MKILIISDTHYKGEQMNQEVHDSIINSDYVIHAGDFSSQNAYDSIKELCAEKEIPLRAVYGNNDPKSLRKIIPEKDIFEIEGIKFGLIHIAGRSLNDNTARWYLLKEMDVDVLIHGHIHTPMVDEHNGKYIICPGSPTLPRLSDKAVVEMIIENGKIETITQKKLGDSMCTAVKFQKYLESKKELNGNIKHKK